MANITEILRDHVTLEVECLDRLYLNGYIPNMQVPGDLINFLVHHRGNKIPSPVLLHRMTTEFRDSVVAYAFERNIPIIKFERGERKDDIAKKYLESFSKPYGVVFIGTAQEKATAFKGAKKDQSGYVGFDYSRQSVFVTYYYFYIYDEEFGPGFIKICTYAPFTMKVCLNGHEWVKRQLCKRGIKFEPLDNGFLSCDDPKNLQAICDELGPEHFQAFLSRWLDRLPLPITREDREAGYSYTLSIWQMEVSLTQVFSRPLKGRQFFEVVIRENIDLGRPDRVQLIFDRSLQKNTPSQYRTRVVQHGVQPSLHVEYKSCHVKQYFKENRALRTETTINDPKDFGVNKNISNLSHLQKIGRNINRRLLDVQRMSQNCMMSEESVKRVVQPTTTKDGQQAPGLRFGDDRVMALYGALTSFEHLTNGFTNQSLRNKVADLLEPEHGTYTSSRMTYDLRRLRLKGMIHRRPGTNRYFVTPYGQKVALFFTKLERCVFRPGFASMDEKVHVPGPISNAFKTLERSIEKLVIQANFEVYPKNLL